jgi:mRNA-degrading endonuclease RelE of RelBE toxin-antitoxin system
MTSPLDLWIEPDAYQARKALPGQVRQRVRREIEALASEPRPHNSRALDVTGLDVPQGVEFRRVRLEHWRILYALNSAEGWVWVLSIQRRPPYDYEDLSELVDLVSE